jgi:hypothetical protein
MSTSFGHHKNSPPPPPQKPGKTWKILSLKSISQFYFDFKNRERERKIKESEKLQKGINTNKYINK